MYAVTSENRPTGTEAHTVRCCGSGAPIIVGFSAIAAVIDSRSSERAEWALAVLRLLSSEKPTDQIDPPTDFAAGLARVDDLYGD